MIEVHALCKNYGLFQALRNISFRVDKGQVVGFLGPNGAGKTTTMRILTCFMPASSGHVTIAGYDVFKQSREVRKRIGYLPENVPLYPEMTVSKYLTYMAKIRGVPSRQRKARLDSSVEACGLTERRHQIIGQLSRGYRQRVGLAQALIHNPDVLILDEPTSGLDPRQIVEIRELIKALGTERTILFSTHILAEASLTCERLLIISRGQITGDVPLSDGRAVSPEGTDASEKTIRLEIAGATTDEVLATLRDIPHVTTAEQVDAETFHIQFAIETDIRAVVAKTIVARGWQLLEMRAVEMTLEEVFLSLTG